MLFKVLLFLFPVLIAYPYCCWNKDSKPRTGPEHNQKDEILGILTNQSNHPAVYHFTGPKEELEDCIELIMRQRIPPNAAGIFMSNGTFDLQLDQIYVLKYVTNENMPTIGIFRNFQWIGLDLNPVGTVEKSHEIIIRSYAEKHELLIDGDGRIGYLLDPVLVQKLKGLSLELIVVPQDIGIDEAYTLCILSGMLSAHEITLKENNGALYPDKPFTVISPDCKYIITWEDDGVWNNVVVELKGNALVEIGTAQDLREEWKCDVVDIEGLKGLFPDEYLDDNRKEWLLDLPDNHFILQPNPRECFTTLPIGNINCLFTQIQKSIRFTMGQDKIVKWNYN